MKTETQIAKKLSIEEINYLDSLIRDERIGWMIVSFICSLIGFGAGYIAFGVILK